MNRREFCKTSVLAAGVMATPKLAAAADAPAAAPTKAAEPAAPAPEVTRYVSEFIVKTRFEDIPADVMALGKKSILDGLGLALSGSVSELAPPLKKYLQLVGATRGPATVIGTKIKTSPRFAALVNGNFMHADDYDDTQLAVAKDRVYGLLTHPTTPALPPALAICQASKLGGKDLLTAYHVGVETECKIAESISPRHYGDGFHSTGTLGSFGSAAAAAKLRKFDAAKTAYVLGIVAPQAGGLRENFGSMMKPFHAGHAAEAGVISADLAGLGWDSAPNILEARYGFYKAAGGGFNPEAIMGQLGNPWTFASPGISIKPHPSGSLTHPAMGVMLRLVRENDVKPADVEKIEIGGNSRMVSTLLHHRPTSGLQAKFSMEFCLAVLLLERKAGLAQFTDEFVRRPVVQEWIRRVDYHVDPDAEAAGFDKMTSVVTLHLKNGKTVSGRAQFAKGSPADPMSYQEVAEKFRGCAEFARWPRAKADAVVELVASLEKAKDLTRLTSMLTA